MNFKEETGLSVKDIDKSFAKVRALVNVTLDVHEGEFFTLLGPSGCGKTTLLRIGPIGASGVQHWPRGLETCHIKVFSFLPYFQYIELNAESLKGYLTLFQLNKSKKNVK